MKLGDKMTSPDEWLREYLSSLASVCFQCLDALKKHSQKCFPPSYNIFATCLGWFHENLAKLVSGHVVHWGRGR